MDFLQKPLVWFSEIYLSVQSKNCGRNSFFCFPFQKFFEFWAKYFQTMAKKLQKFVKTTFYVSRGTICGLNFFRFRIVLDFLQKPSAWFPNFYIRVQSKNCGRNSFLIFLFRIFFGFWVKNFSDFRPKNFKKLSKLPSARPEEHFLTLIFFKKFWTVLDFLQKPLVWFSKIYLSVQSKNCGKNVFFFAFFPEFFSIFEQKFFRLWAKRLQKVFETTFYVSRGTVCGLKFFF